MRISGSRLGELTEMLELQPVLNKPVRKLSLGERMKCELAVALLHGPKILFLDEPTIGLDVNMQQAVRRFVADYNARTGATVILTSHYMADVEALAERVLVIDGGRLVFDGNLSALVAERAPNKVLKLQLAHPVSRGAPGGVRAGAHGRRLDGGAAGAARQRGGDRGAHPQRRAGRRHRDRGHADRGGDGPAVPAQAGGGGGEVTSWRTIRALLALNYGISLQYRAQGVLWMITGTRAADHDADLAAAGRRRVDRRL